MNKVEVAEHFNFLLEEIYDSMDSTERQFLFSWIYKNPGASIDEMLKGSEQVSIPMSAGEFLVMKRDEIFKLLRDLEFAGFVDKFTDVLSGQTLPYKWRWNVSAKAAALVSAVGSFYD